MTDVSNAELERTPVRQDLRGNLRMVYLVLSNTKTVKLNAFCVPSSYEVRLLDTQPHARNEHIRRIRRRTLPQSLLVWLLDPLRSSLAGYAASCPQ